MLDFKTLLTVNFIVNMINMLTMAVLWGRYGRKFQGLSLWFANMAMHVAGVGLILLRGTLPAPVAIVAGNTLLMSSTLFLLAGMERFTGMRGRPWGNAAAFSLYVLALAYFTVVRDDIAARTMAGSALIVFVDAQTCWLLFARVPPAMRRFTFFPGLVMAGYVAASLARIAILAALPVDDPLLRSGLADSVAVTAYISLHICLMISLALALTRRLMDEVLAQEEKFAKAFHSSPYALVITRRQDGRIIEVNEGFSAIFGHPRRHALGRTMAELGMLPRGGPPDAGGPRREARFLRASGEPMVGQLTCESLVINGEECELSSIADITEESELRRRLEELATTDSLTGLPNRRFFGQRFTAARDAAFRRGAHMALMSIDLDRFKEVNDRLGHAAGDAVLVEAAARILGCLRKTDVVARFGGDEFVVLLSEIAGRQDAALVAGKIVQALREPFRVRGEEARLSGSVGVSIFPDHGEGLEALLNRSDRALYRMKQAGRDGCMEAGREGQA